jgi:hypothetical protein
MTLAPPPATIVQMHPFGFKTVNFREALVRNSKDNISHYGSTKYNKNVADWKYGKRKTDVPSHPVHG